MIYLDHAATSHPKPEAVVTVDVHGTRLKSVVASSACPREGATLPLALDMGRAAFFHPETHRNLQTGAEAAP